MKFREHRGGLIESMETLVDLPDRTALIDHCRKLLAPFKFEFNATALKVTPYFVMDGNTILRGNDRIGWKEVYIVTIDGYGV